MISGCKSCVGEGLVVLITSGMMVTRGRGVSEYSRSGLL